MSFFFFALTVLFIPSFHVLKGFIYVSLNVVAVPTVLILINAVIKVFKPFGFNRKSIRCREVIKQLIKKHTLDLSIFRIVRLKYVFFRFFVLRKQGPENITFPVFS